jgi:type II secretory ATPase GspE/PulE/Tfp pilus assembly ATPase PilB-like protein
LSNAIKNNHTEVFDILKNKKIKTLADNAIELLNKGLTSFEEVYPLLQINYY